MSQHLDALLHDIAHGRSAQRRKAASKLAQLRDPASVVPLIGMLGHPDFSTRCLIIATLGKIGDSRAFDPLAALLEDSMFYCDELVLAFGGIDDPRSVPLLMKKLHEGEVWESVCAADALGSLRPPGAADSLLAAAKSNRPQPRYHSLIALAKFKDEPGLFEKLSPILATNDRGTLRVGGKTLLTIDLARARDLLRPKLRDQDVDVRRGAAEALAEFGDPDAKRALMTFGCYAF